MTYDIDNAKWWQYLAACIYNLQQNFAIWELLKQAFLLQLSAGLPRITILVAQQKFICPSNWLCMFLISVARLVTVKIFRGQILVSLRKFYPCRGLLVQNEIEILLFDLFNNFYYFIGIGLLLLLGIDRLPLLDIGCMLLLGNGRRIARHWSSAVDISYSNLLKLHGQLEPKFVKL